jgi:RNA polymerase sigma-54 factor
LEDVEKVAKIISQMNPKPGSEFDKERIEYIVPDIYLYKLGDEYFILLNNDGLPKLRINPLYLKILRSKNSYPEEVRAYIHNKLTAAVWLIKSIHQRETTLYKVTESIVKFQREFFDKGIAYLKPLTLKDVGDDINMHESTISRVTTNKYISTPQGIFELKFFFSSGIRGLDGKHVTSIWIKNRIKDIISKENPKKPLSDNMISEILKRSGIKISRRTVAKYRESIGILPSSKRKRMF